jgi:hypothetical protein
MLKQSRTTQMTTDPSSLTLVSFGNRAVRSADPLGGVAPRGRLRVLVTGALALLVGCGGTSPVTPSGNSSIVPLGAQVLRISPGFPCTQLTPGMLPLVVTRIVVSASGDGWLASSIGSDAGDVTLRLQQSGGANVRGSIFLAGSITGNAIHMPDLLSVPPWQLRATFGVGATLSGVAFAAGSLNSLVAGMDGVGNGPLVLTDAAGKTCSGSGFSWSTAEKF